jgi:hypothetical protein
MTENLTPLACENTIDSTQKDRDYSNPIIPYYSLYPDKLVIHPKPFINITKRKPHANSLNNLKSNKYTGYMSPATRSRVKKILTAWISSIQCHNSRDIATAPYAQRRPVFATLTLCSTQVHSDKEIKRQCLDPFIKAIKRKYSGIKYMWRAESQENGSIHFHLILDQYINHKELRTLWNHYQNKLEYVNKFVEKYGHNSPNSTDIKGVSDVRDFIDYIVKYVAKEGEYREIIGAIWGMSDELRECKVYQDLLDWDLSGALTKAVNNEQIKVYSQEYCSVLFFTKEFRLTTEYRLIQQRSHNYYVNLYAQIYLHPPVQKRMIDTIKETVIEGEKQGCLFTDEAYKRLILDPKDKYEHRKAIFNKNFGYRVLSR